MQRPRCSTKLPYSLRSIAPRVFSVFTLMRARRSSAARAVRRISGDARAVAMTVRRESFIDFPLKERFSRGPRTARYGPSTEKR